MAHQGEVDMLPEEDMVVAADMDREDMMAMAHEDIQDRVDTHRVVLTVVHLEATGSLACTQEEVVEALKVVAGDGRPNEQWLDHHLYKVIMLSVPSLTYIMYQWQQPDSTRLWLVVRVSRQHLMRTVL